MLYISLSLIRLICEVGANPKPDIQWLFNGRPIDEESSGGKYKIKNNGNTRMLIVKKLDDADAGEYKYVSQKWTRSRVPVYFVMRPL